MPTKLRSSLLPLLHHRGRGARRVTPVGESTRIRKRQRITFLLVESRRSDAEAWLGEQGWRLVAPIAARTPPPAEPTEAEVIS
ncbi:MAG: hypothetical protein R3F24_10735 [Gammaproteobacteria bacterium]